MQWVWSWHETTIEPVAKRKMNVTLVCFLVAFVSCSVIGQNFTAENTQDVILSKIVRNQRELDQLLNDISSNNAPVCIRILFAGNIS